MLYVTDAQDVETNDVTVTVQSEPAEASRDQYELTPAENTGCRRHTSLVATFCNNYFCTTRR